MTVTAFTLAHSITLSLATLGVVHVPGPPLEASIAFSIMLLAYEIVRLKRGQVSLTAQWPWVVAFSFGSLAWIACGASALDDRRWLVSDKLPGAVLPYPNSEIAIVNVHDRAGHQDLRRHSSGHERGAVNNQNAVCRMRNLEVGKIAGPDPMKIAHLSS